MRADLIRAINGRPVEAEPVMMGDEVTTVLGGQRTGQYAAAGYGTRVTDGRGPLPPTMKHSPWFWVAIVAACVLVLAAGTFGLVQLLGGGGNDVTVPNLVGQTQAQATKTLQDAGLTPDFSNAQSTPQQKGQVVSTDPEAGFGLKRGSTVSVVIGAGPAQITLDDYKGLQFEDAASQLRSKGLTPVRKDVNNSEGAGTVLSTNPAANTKVVAGQRITLNVSTGKTALPDVVGRSEQDATQILNDAGYSQIERQVVPPPDDQEAGTVFRTDPNAGTPVSSDQTITLFIAKEKPTPTPTTPSPTPTTPSPTPTATPTSSPATP
jgi:serine/threonine-protein kinase